MKNILTSLSPPPNLNFIDLFAGAGGLSCGLEQAGMRCLLGVDFDPWAMKTFAQNHRHAAVFCGDIGKLTKAKLLQLTNGQKIHIVAGGPPCQGFSTVGKGDPLDLRNRLFEQYCRVVKIINPQFILMENVTGLLAKKNEKTLSAMINKLSALGFQLNVKVMEAEKYGVPEKRRRTIILGHQSTATPTFPEYTHDTIVDGKFIPAKTVGEVLEDIKSSCGSYFNHDLKSATLKNSLDEKRLKKIPEGKGIRYQCDELTYLPPKLRLGVNWQQLPEGRFRQTKFQRLSRSLPSPTIMTHRLNYYHPTSARYLTPREAAKLQSFPNDFVFLGPLAAQWKQIGNAVPPLLAQVLGKHIGQLSLLKSKLPDTKSPLKKKSSFKKLQSTVGAIRKKAFVYKENI